MKKVRIGVVGAGRGASMIKACKVLNTAEIVAICDKTDSLLDAYRNDPANAGITFFNNYHAFLKFDLDAVVLANFAHQHGIFAIEALKAGKHVFSEVLPCQNMKEAVALVEAVEESGKVYYYAENYCFMNGPHEMRKRFREGLIGEFEYGECEYVHNCEPIWPEIAYGDKTHWRNRLMYSTFYCTHSIGPMVHATGLRPVKVIGIESVNNGRNFRAGCQGANFGIEMLTLSNGAIVKSMHGNLYDNCVWYTMFGSKGSMETARLKTGEGEYDRLYVKYDEHSGEYNEKEENYCPEGPLQKICKENGFTHGGSDLYTVYNFIEKIQGREAECIDVYEALDMFLPGLFAYRSILAGNAPMAIPDLRKKEERDRWRNDTACVDEEIAGDALLPTTASGTPDIPKEVYFRQQALWEKKKEKFEKKLSRYSNPKEQYDD